MSEKRELSFQAEVSEVLRLVVNSLYSHKEIFIRELVSNASDALDRLRFKALSDPNLVEGDAPLVIRLIPDEEAGTLTVWDNGLGMTDDELAKNLGTIARSGTREFAEELRRAQEAQQQGARFIGQFGVGFYSAYLVADQVEVVSRHAGSAQAHRWASDAKESFTIEAAERELQGTSVVLHLKEDCKDFLKRFKLRELTAKYSDYIDHPIELPKQQSDEEIKEGKPVEFEQVNQGSALWQRSPKDVSDEQYEEFYKHLSHDWEPPVARRHFQVEGTQLFSGLLFLPKRPPFDLYDANAKHGVRLHVKRVFVMEDCEELLPRYLRFIRGVVDSEDLPLNVSREILQDSRVVRVIRKQVVSNALSMIEELAAERPDEYRDFWKEFGAALKEGLHFNSEDAARISKLVRYESSTQEGLTSLEGYVERMKEGQPAIYFALGQTKDLLASSPHLEALKKRGFEVLYMTDPIDSFAVESLEEFDGKPLVNAMNAELDLGADTEDEAAKQDKEAAKDRAQSLMGRFKAVLGDHVSEVRASARLTDSPVCLVVPEGGLPPHMERILQARNMAVPRPKRILEVNPSHPVINTLRALHDSNGDSGEVAEWIEVLYDQALIAEGSPVEDPAGFAQRVTKLLGRVTSSAAASSGAGS